MTALTEIRRPLFNSALTCASRGDEASSPRLFDSELPSFFEWFVLEEERMPELRPFLTRLERRFLKVEGLECGFFLRALHPSANAKEAKLEGKTKTQTKTKVITGDRPLPI